MIWEGPENSCNYGTLLLATCDEDQGTFDEAFARWDSGFFSDEVLGSAIPE